MSNPANGDEELARLLHDAFASRAALSHALSSLVPEGIDRAYPAVWDKSYPQYSSMTLPGQ